MKISNIETMFKPGITFKIKKKSYKYDFNPNRVYTASCWKLITEKGWNYNTILEYKSLNEFFIHNIELSNKLPSYEIIVGEFLSLQELNSSMLILDQYLDENIFLLKTLIGERIIFLKVPIKSYDISYETIINSVEFL